MIQDALDRFGSQLEQRFTWVEVAAVLTRTGRENIVFSEQELYWSVCATKQSGFVHGSRRKEIVE
jgi:hypothetical protein